METDIKRKYIKSILNRSIILFGAGYRMHCFYRINSKYLSIDRCLSNEIKSGECSLDQETNLMIYSPTDIVPKMKNDEFIIICVDDYKEIEKQLVYYGLRMGEHFIHYSLFDLLMSEKKIALFYGVCYMRPISELIKKSSSFVDEYEVFCFLSYKVRTDVEHTLLEFLLSICDLYIYNTSFSRQERSIENALMSHLSDSSKMVKLPVVGGEAYHPQVIQNQNDVSAYNVVPEKSAYGPFTSQDWYVNKLIDEGKDFDNIRKVIKDRSFLNHDYIRENYEEKFRIIEFQESNADIKISDFLAKNHRKKRLYLDGAHVGNEPICEMANRLLNYLGFERIDYSDEKESVLIYSSEVPIYPCVIEALDLEVYADGESEYNLFTFNGYIKVTFDEYLYRYYDYCIHMRDYLKKGYFI